MSEYRSVSSATAEPLAVGSARPAILCPGQSEEFRARYNRTPFEFAHSLAEHPLFEIDRLAALAAFLEESRLPGRVTLFSDDAAVTQGWQRSRAAGVNAAECLARIETSHSWLLLKDVQTHPDYRDLVDRFVDDLEAALACRVRPEISWIDAYLFVSSPGMVTPYHIDHETNFLLQVRGDKTVNLFDPSDRSILSDPEIERYYAGDFNAAHYDDGVQPRAMVFELVPGRAVHHPPLAPHWVRTGSRPSVSLSILFFLRSFDAVAKVYQANHYLRRLGLRPTPPGRSAWRDRVKQALMSDLGYRPQQKAEVLRTGVSKYREPVAFLSRRVRQALSRQASPCQERGREPAM